MSFVLHALLPRATGARVALATALALAATSAAVLTATSATATVATSDTIWGPNAPTSAAVDPDTSAVELGTRFSAVTGGQATAVRFYKTPENRGTHTGSLWTSTGTLLGRIAFTGETASGWQTATLSAPVTLTAGGSYVVSYHTSVGRYTATERFTGTSASPNLRIPTPNVGVYAYGANSAFPTDTWHASQYWVDLAFTTNGSTPTTTATPQATPTDTPTPAQGTTSSSPSHTITPPASTTPSGTTATSAPSVTAVGTTSTPTNKTTKASSASSSPPAAVPSGPTGSGQTNCASLPSRCGYPDATNTGVPAGTTLLRVPQDVTSGPGWVWDSRGWLQASSGAVVSNVIVSGSINVAGSNITVKNTRILVSGESWGIGLQHATNSVVSNNEIGILGGTPRLMVGVKDIYGDSSGSQVLRNNIANTATGIQVFEGLIADNYVHDMGYASGDHVNGSTSNGSTTMLTIRHNTILNKFDQTDAISLFQDFGIEANRLITDNLVAGGGYSIYGGDNQRFGKTSNIKITNNRFSTLYYSKGGYYGPIAAFDPTGSGNVASGNYWDNTIAPVNF
jgi:Domain of unknown function (DUF4082)